MSGASDASGVLICLFPTIRFSHPPQVQLRLIFLCPIDVDVKLEYYPADKDFHMNRLRHDRHLVAHAF